MTSEEKKFFFHRSSDLIDLTVTDSESPELFNDFLFFVDFFHRNQTRVFEHLSAKIVIDFYELQVHRFREEKKSGLSHIASISNHRPRSVRYE